jgi:hypothetical protein
MAAGRPGVPLDGWDFAPKYRDLTNDIYILIYINI